MIMDSINSVLQFLDKIQGLSAVALIFLSCIIVGYCLRFLKKFPNDGIPVVVILWGAVAMLIIADPRASTIPARIWTARNLCVGLVIGFVAWVSHKIILSRIEDFIASKIPGSGNTTFFSRKDTDVLTKPQPEEQPKNK